MKLTTAIKTCMRISERHLRKIIIIIRKTCRERQTFHEMLVINQ